METRARNIWANKEAIQQRLIIFEIILLRTMWQPQVFRWTLESKTNQLSKLIHKI